MSRTMSFRGAALTIALAFLAVAGAASAGQEAQSGATQPAVVQAEPEGAVPQLGVDPKPRRGVYAETSLGVFTTAGGSHGLSNAQAYLGMAVGHDIGEAAAVFVQLGIGASSASCFDGSSDNCRAADSFGATFVEVGIKYGAQLASRLRLSGLLVGGLTILSPSPIFDTGSKSVPNNLFGPHGGVGAALDYDTHLEHFAVGLDVLARYSLAGRPAGGSFSLLSFAAMPRIKYVF